MVLSRLDTLNLTFPGALLRGTPNTECPVPALSVNANTMPVVVVAMLVFAVVTVVSVVVTFSIM